LFKNCSLLLFRVVPNLLAALPNLTLALGLTVVTRNVDDFARASVAS
jgi:hypothetical protein